MFSIIQDIFEPSLLDIPTTLITKPNRKRWHMAFIAIYCSRAFSSSLAKPKRISSPVSSTTVVIDILELHPCFLKIDQSVLTQIVKQKNLDLFKKYDGVKGLALILKTNLEHGIEGDVDISGRNKAFGSNTYWRPPAEKLWYFVWKDLRDPPIVILLFFAALSLGFGIKENGLKEGWYILFDVEDSS